MRKSLLLALLLAVSLAGCGDSGDDPDDGTGGNGGDGGDGNGDGAGDGGMGAAEALAVSAVGLYPVTPAFDPAELHATPGATVSLTFTNEDTNQLVVHNWVVDGIEGAGTESIASGESTTIEFRAPMQPGEHTYYCSIGDHRDRGMVGVLHVMAA